MSKLQVEFNDLQIVPKNEYTPELEAKVAYYLAIIPRLPKNDKKIVRAKDPDLRDPLEVNMYRREELRRIREGANGMSGKMYFFYNYVYMLDVEVGRIRPEFRVCQNVWFKTIEDAQKSNKYGVICVKRRRIGASWLEAADVLHDAITLPGRKFGMTSKTEVDSVELFKKVKFIYDNLPQWLRPTTSAGNTRTSMDFSWKEKDTKGNWIRKGLQSEIIVRAPVATGWEGYTLRKLIIDEAGKIEKLKNIYSFAVDTMMKGMVRVGTPVIFGTAGDIDKDGKDLMEMWYQADKYSLTQFFFGGWMGVITDEFGNDNEEEAVRAIIYKRKTLEGLSSKEYNDFLQKYPLTVAEAFTANSDVGLGNKVKIQKQIDFLNTNPLPAKRGYFRPNASGKPMFVPSPQGKCIIYEEPKEGIKNLSCAGCDPVDHVTENVKKASSLSMFIMNKQSGLEAPKIVFEYTDRPEDPRDAYEQCMMALIYYNNTKVLIENNRYGMITYFEENGLKYLLATTPQGLTKLVSKGSFNIGFYKTKYVTAHQEELIISYIEDHYDIIPSIELLHEFNKYGLQNCDRIDGFAATLMFLKEDKTTSKQLQEGKKTIPDWSYKRINGQIKLTR